MKEEKTLSDKMIFMKSADGELIQCIYYAHVMDFIKKLKEDYLKLGTRVLNNKSDQDVLNLIDKLAGESLI